MGVLFKLLIVIVEVWERITTRRPGPHEGTGSPSREPAARCRSRK
jgi:hypothetical protein